jgi:hypothetical protein
LNCSRIDSIATGAIIFPSLFTNRLFKKEIPSKRGLFSIKPSLFFVPTVYFISYLEKTSETLLKLYHGVLGSGMTQLSSPKTAK